MHDHSPFPEKGMPVTGDALLTDVSLPAAVVFADPLRHNIAWMQRFAERHGSLLAPHGKTTMTPALFRRQLAAGAWGITLATATQCASAFAHGVARILMANQLVGRPNMAIVAGLIERGADIYCVVDSVANVEDLARYFGARGLTLQVLIEMGVPGGRCGVRDAAGLDTLVKAIAERPALALRGIEGYEGMIHGDQPVADVRAYGKRLVDTVRMLHATSRFTDRPPIVTASGSKWFDLIAEAFRAADSGGTFVPLLRPGCYVTHDHRLYREAMDDVARRQPDLEGRLEPALAVFAQIQSLPEPGLAVVAMGKRDIACDPDLPIPLECHHPGRPPRPLSDVRVRHVMDQHTMLEIPHDSGLAVGDVLSFGTSHPCLTFDKWRRVLLVDADLDVREVMPTFF